MKGINGVKGSVIPYVIPLKLFSDRYRLRKSQGLEKASPVTGVLPIPTAENASAGLDVFVL